MRFRTSAILLALAAMALVTAGCGGGDDSTDAIPTITAPTGNGGASTGDTGSKGAKKSGGSKSDSSGGAAAPVPEKKCGKVFFPGTEQRVPVTAAALPCPKALAYAKRFVQGEQPSQQNLPSGWSLKDCTGINDAPPTPGAPNSPRCHHGQQAFTIHVSQ